MKAVAVIPGTKNSLHVRADVPDPKPTPDEALVKVLEAGVCGTDVEIHQGLYGQAPPGSPYLVLGHENLGVVETSPKGNWLSPGDLVVSTVRRPCREACLPCLSDQNDMCLTGHYRERGIGGLHGFMSERYAESPRYLVRLAAHLRPVAVLLEPMSVVQKGIEQAFRIQQRLAWDPRKAVVLGAGPVGILAALVLRLRGLEVHVAALEPKGSPKDDLLHTAGIGYISTSSTPLETIPSSLGRIDVVFEATGASAVVFPAISLLGADGVCVLSSVTGGERKIEVDVAAWNRSLVLSNRLVFGTVNAARRHFESGVRDMELAEERFPGWLARLITRRVPFTEAPRALERSIADIKTVLEFN
jgi:threonine dehydrogenase-like Zn-dependent dehydrogenase